jgi:hypothetical protein
VTPARLVADARQLLSGMPGRESLVLWHRACAVVIRHAIETHVGAVLRRRAPGAQAANFRVQFLCLRPALGGVDLASEIAATWSALSQAIHHNGYELAPTGTELEAWLRCVEEFIGAYPA